MSNISESFVAAAAEMVDTHHRHFTAAETEESMPQNVVFGLAIILSGGAFLYHNLAFLRLPYTVVMFAFGIVMGLIGIAVEDTTYGNIFTSLGDVSPHLVFHIFLPILIFEGSYGMKTHAFWSIFSFVLLLAGPGLIINCAFIACALKVMYPVWNWYLAGLLGSILSATDPVAVVALLKDLGVDKRITAMVDGEAIMNDGTAIIAFTILLPAATYGSIQDPWWEVLLQCVRLTIGAVAFGLLCGAVTKWFLERSRRSELVQTCITVSFAYMAFFISDVWLKTSGVLVLCFMGVYLATYMPTLFPGKEGSTMNTTWHFLVHISNTALFAIVGVVLARDVGPYLNVSHIYKVIILYIVATVARFLMIIILKPTFMFNKNYVVGLRETVLLTHGGLRGGVATMLALMVLHTDGISSEDGAEVLILTSGIVFLTLAVNATTAQAVVGLLGHRSKDQNRLTQMEIGTEHVHQRGKKALRGARLHPFFTNTNWDKVESVVRDVVNPYEGVSAVSETQDRVYNVLVMRACKTKIWTMRDSETITEDAVRILTTALAKCISKGTIVTAEENILPLMTYPFFLSLLYKLCFPKTPDVHAGDVFAFGNDNKQPLPKRSYISRWVLQWRLRVDEDFIGTLIGYSEALASLEETQLYKHYATKPAHVAAVEDWLAKEKEAIGKKLKLYEHTHPQSMCAFMTKSAAAMVVSELAEEAEHLHTSLGFAVPAVEALVNTCGGVRLSVSQWPVECEPIKSSDLLMRSAVLRNFPIDKLSALQSAVREHTFERGEEVSVGACGVVILSGVARAFGSVERMRGPGDCFNVAPALCRTVGTEYVVTSKYLTVMAIPYTVLQDAYRFDQNTFSSMLSVAVDEVLAPVAKYALSLTCRGSSVADLAETLKTSGRTILAPKNGYTFEAEEASVSHAVSSSQSHATLSITDRLNREPTTHVTAAATQFALSSSANATTESPDTVAPAITLLLARPQYGMGTTPLAVYSPAEARLSLPSLTPGELLMAITNGRREHLFFITGASTGIDGGITSLMGPCVVPVSAATRLQWRTGTALFACAFPQQEEGSHRSSHRGGHRLYAEGGEGAVFTDISGTDDNSSASVVVDVGAMTRAGGPPTPEDTELVMSPSRYFNSELQPTASHPNLSPTLTKVKGFPASTIIDLQLVLRSAAESLSRYDPDNCLTAIPYFNKLQLKFLVVLEQLMAAVSRFVESHGSDVYERSVLAATTEAALDFLQVFCLESFSAERIFHARLLHSARSRCKLGDSRREGVSDTTPLPPLGHNASSQQRLINASSPNVEKEPFATTTEALETSIREHESEHNAFTEKVASWRERTANNDMCHDAVVLGMSTFASTHFPKDKAMCMEAMPFVPGMAQMANREAINPL